MRKLAYIIVLLLVMPVIASAQVAKQVEVSKDYTPTINSAQKLSIVPDMSDTVKMNPDIDYTITPRSYQTSLMMQNFKPATITYWDFKRSRPFYARAAIGAPYTTEADAYVSTFNKDKGYAMAYVNHWGDYRKRPMIYTDEKRSDARAELSNRLGGRAGLFLGPRRLEFDIYGDEQLRHRYPTTGERIHFGKGQAKLRFGDDFTDLSRWNFDIELQGGLFADGNKIAKFNESNLSAKVAVGKMVGKHVLRIHAGYDGIFGSKQLGSYKNNSLMAGARYGISSNRFEFLLGADYYHDKVSNATDTPHHIFPYLRMTWKNSSEGFVPFVEVDGGLKRHDFGSLMYENPYFSPVETTGEELSALPNESVYNGRIGFGGSLGKRVFSYSLSAELALADEHLYWYSRGADYYFATAYQYSLRIDGQMKLRPAGWFEAEVAVGVYAWENYDSYYSNRPSFDAGLDLRYTGRKITAGINLGYKSSIKWLTMDDNSQMSYIKTDGTFTLGVEAEWRINERWAVFAEGRNLTGSKVYEWLHYYKDSPQGLVGAKFTF